MPRGGKRAGAGRKPTKSRRKLSHFSTRITAELRAELEREAKRKGHSLSAEIERRLVQSKKLEDWLKANRGAPHIVGLAELVAHLARAVESTTGKNYRNDAFTFRTLQLAIQHALSALDHNYGPIVTPAKVSGEDASLIRRGNRQEPRTPESIGTFVADSIWMYVRIVDLPNPTDLNYSDIHFSLAKMRDMLGIKQEPPQVLSG